MKAILYIDTKNALHTSKLK